MSKTTRKRYTKAEIASWPSGHRPCVQCDKMQSFDQYHKHRQCLFGVNTVCLTCRHPKSKAQYHSASLEQHILDRARSRAKRRSMEFNLELSDIVVPKICPVFGVPMVRGTRYAPSIDRIDSAKGYIKGNIQIISIRANQIKTDATVDEIRKVLQFCEGACEYV